ncbi:MAG: MerR family transcriptional regulator [Alphaproteobacteria bacterium]
MAETLSSPGTARRGGKSAAAFRTISEVAGELDIPQHVLRFWETKFSQIKPLKRGGGRRYYRPEDIALLRRIKSLLYSDGYTIKGVQKLLREGGGKEGRGDGAAAAAETAARSGGENLPPERRAQVEAVLGELVAVRDLLKRRP